MHGLVYLNSAQRMQTVLPAEPANSTGQGGGDGTCMLACLPRFGLGMETGSVDWNRSVGHPAYGKTILRHAESLLTFPFLLTPS